MCSICANDFNQTKRKELTCNGCNESCCMICFETYIVLSMKDPDCMFCHKLFDREFFLMNTSGALQKRIKSHREKVLLDREKAKLPETMELHFEYDLNMKNLMRKVDLKKTDLQELSQSIQVLTQTKDKNKDQRLELKEIKKNKRDTLNYIRLNLHRVYRWYIFEKTDDQSLVVTSVEKPQEKTKKIMCQCPQPDCNGFVYNTETCGVCNVSVCKECRCVKNETHICNKSDVETVKMLNADSKGCPKCATLIFKISGCDQMWCTQCHTAFGWKTGKIVSSNIHNPHYFHWLHNNQDQNIDRNQDNLNQCGGQIEYGQLTIHARLICPETQVLTISEMFRLRIHLENMELFRVRPNVPLRNEETVNLDLRLRYLRKDISEEKWMFLLQKREKVKLFTQSKLQIFEMVITVINDLFHRILHINTITGVEEILNEFFKLIDYANSSFVSLKKLYKVVVPNFIFDPVWNIWTI